MSKWEEVKHNGVLLVVNGFIPRLWSALRVLFSGKIILGVTWAQIDEMILKNKQNNKPKGVSNKEIQ